ncbi:Uncharacterized protein SCF082_LOCUS31718, partial [Durusdinium trenchii]
MTRFSRFPIAALAAVLLVLAGWLSAPAAIAQSLPIGAFYGHFQGSGVAENSDSLYFGVTVRDLDVKIGPEGSGFYVEWTSVIRGGGDPNNPDIRRRSQRMAFMPDAEPNVFRAVGRDDPRGTGLAWARINDRTLSVHVMQITASGGYVIQTYNRTLEGTGMRLKFINVANGEPQREVDARLVK